VRIQAFAVFGEILIFRLTQHAVVQLLGWKRLGQKEALLIHQALKKLPEVMRPN
jgi:hypothetical protein